MSYASALRPRRFLALSLRFACAWLVPIAPAVAQGWAPARNDLLPLIGLETPSSLPVTNQPPQGQHRGPLARLVENPDQTDGTPPYALTDQNGTIQRFVEPVPGIDLASHVGQIVMVRNDTGPTLLASQLELPREGLRPLIAQPQSSYGMAASDLAYQSLGRSRFDGGVRPVQYIDEDDTSVQLLPDNMGGMPPGYPGPGSGQIPLMVDGYPGAMMPGPMCGAECGPQCGGSCYGQPCCDPMTCGPGMMQPYAGPMAPYSPYGGYPNYVQVPNQPCQTPAAATSCPQRPHIAGDVEFLFYRVHMSDDVVGKLSENFEFSPRFTLDFRNIGPFDGRVRYWTYGRDTNVVGVPGDVRFEWDVLDIETMHYFEGRRSQLSLSAGIRFVNAEIEDPNGNESESNMVGLTMAADGLTPVIRMRNGYCGWVYGGRLSLLGSDWGGDTNSVFLDERFRDDNTLVTELYLGAELARCCGRTTVRGRLLFDMQNWRSDALATEADVESIGFIGPALQLGADF